MTAVRPEGGAQAGGGRPGRADEQDWGVYEQAPGFGAASVVPAVSDETLRLRAMPGADGVAVAPTGGRAERRRAAAGRGSGRRRATGRGAGRSAGTGRPRPKEPKRVVVARFIGEMFITLGTVMLLFVAYQLWWTNVEADASADGARSQLEQQWSTQAPPAPGDTIKPAGAFEPGQGFAILYIPKLGIKYPIAEGTDKQKVLDKGLVGHYAGTAMPTDQTGNFAVAAHRTTHGQPFRRLAELLPGDKIVVETATSYYTYQVAGGIPETPPTNVTVLQPIPKGSPFTQPGRYLTMTTCTPEFSARGRLIVFGKLVEERPRSQGQPAALAGS